LKLEIYLKEIEVFLSKYYHINVGLEYIEENKIKINYFVHFILSIKEIKKDEIVFCYDLNVITNLLVKSAHILLKKKLKNIPLKWDSKTKEVTIDLKKINALSEFLKFLFITELRFVNEAILLEINAKSDE
jgi:hypothetical protein